MNHIIHFLLLQLDLTLPKHPNVHEAKMTSKGALDLRIQFSSKLKTNLMKTQRGALLNTQTMRSKTKN